MTFLIAWVASLVILIMPLWQGRDALSTFGRFMSGGRRKEAVVAEVRSSEDNTAADEVDEKRGVEILQDTV